MITLDTIRKPVAADLEAFDEFVDRQFTAEGELLSGMLRYALSSRGKGVRPLLVMLSAAMNAPSRGATTGRRACLAAMLVEMIHIASLIHDDVIDESDTRRGRPSVNARWQSHKAVILGDYILARNMNIGLRSGQFDLVTHVCGSMAALCEGEVLQSDCAERHAMTRRTYLDIIFKKTASLIGVSASAGAMAAGAPNEKVALMQRFGEALGMAFQMQDDILDYKPSARTGKPAYNDLREGKITLPLLCVMERMDESRQAEVGVIVAKQFGASAFESQLGFFANFIAYAFMGIPAGLMLRRIGYKKTAMAAVTVGFVGVGVQYLSGAVGSFAVYLTGAFICGFSVCMLNTVVNPMLNTLGGGGDKGNQLLQFGGACNSIGATIVPFLVGYLMGAEAGRTIEKANPALFIAMAIFAVAFVVLAASKIPEPHMEQGADKAPTPDRYGPMSFRHFVLGTVAIFIYVGIEIGLPSTANLYMTQELGIDAAVAGSIVGLYWLLMLVGRLVGGSVGARADRALRSLHLGHVGRHLQPGGRGTGQVYGGCVGHLHGHGLRRRHHSDVPGLGGRPYRLHGFVLGNVRLFRLPALLCGNWLPQREQGYTGW